jgi:hypothetical protein
VEEPVPKQEPRPLEYRSPRDDPRPLHPLLPFVGGFLLSMVFLACFGALIVLGTYSPGRPGEWKSGHRIGGAFTMLAATAVGLSVVVWNRKSARRRFFLLGFLLGIGIAGLAEGLCFASQ